VSVGVHTHTHTHTHTGLVILQETTEPKAKNTILSTFAAESTNHE
jgi:hypothetical protein